MTSAAKTHDTDPYSVMIIADDGRIDGYLTDALSADSKLKIVGHYFSGIDAISAFRRQHCDVVVLDIGMANEDPLTTIRRLLRVDRHTKIIMASTLSFANVRQSMMGFEIGAAEFVQTPSDFTGISSFAHFQAEFCRVVRSLAKARRQEGVRPAPTARPTPSPPTEKIELRPASRERPQILAIGSSTGGPQALMTVLQDLPGQFALPIVITQHMPKTFTTVLATTLSKRTGKTAVEGETGMALKPNHVYIAPGDHHMTFRGRPGNVEIVLNQDPAINFCRPSVEPMVESIVKIYGAKTLLTILTGMGSDGKNGAEMVANAKGTVIAQDFETSTVWGMPGVVAKAGLCSKVLPVTSIGAAINKLTAG